MKEQPIRSINGLAVLAAILVIAGIAGVVFLVGITGASGVRPSPVLLLGSVVLMMVAVLPLIGKDTAMVEQARGLYEDPRKSISVEYDDAAAIGKRYRRQDDIGTPWALTIDEQTLADGTITLRDRDTLQQERIPLDGAKRLLLDKLEQPWHPRA